MKKPQTNIILKERVDLYKDFTINLLNYIYDTYLGKEFIKTKEDIEGHYNWAYSKVLGEFYDEDIDFYGNDSLYYYFLGYYTERFYNLNKPNQLLHYEKFWLEIFDLQKNKKRKIFDVLLEIYKTFDKSLTRNVIEEELLV